MRIACSVAAFPSLRLEDRFRMVALLGFKRVGACLFVAQTDLPGFLRRPDRTTRRIVSVLEETGLSSADLFLIAPGDSIEGASPNCRENEGRKERRRIFATGLRCAQKAGVGALTILPGLPWADDPRAGWGAAVDELRWRVEQAGDLRIELRVEPHIGSIISTPELTARMLDEVRGLRLALDPGHFIFQGIDLEQVLPLAPMTGFVHVSGAAAGSLHIRLARNKVDFRALLTSLRAAHYMGDLCIEYVPMDKWGADTTDAVSAIVETENLIAELMVG